MPVPARAQAEKLAGRFPPASEAALRALLDSARGRGLPVGPLTQRALEGASRGIDADRIVVAVRGLYARLVTARQTIGAQASEADLVAAASALYVGVSPDVLDRIHQTAHQQSVALRLVVLSDMIDRGVPRDTASAIILSLTDAGVPDESFQLLRQSVLLDIRSGIAPSVAASTRARGVLVEHTRGVRAPEPVVKPRRP